MYRIEERETLRKSECCCHSCVSNVRLKRYSHVRRRGVSVLLAWVSFQDPDGSDVCAQMSGRRSLGRAVKEIWVRAGVWVSTT